MSQAICQAAAGAAANCQPHQAGITDFRFHDRRHTFASNLVMSGVDLMTVKELLGHKTIQMTLRYSHLSQAHKKTAVETISRILGGYFLDTLAESADPGFAGQVCKSAI